MDKTIPPLQDLFTSNRKVLTVSELTHRIKSCLEKNIGYIWVSGEVCNLRIPSSGHHYFSLKDESAQIRCVLWRTTAQNLKFHLTDGMEVILFGSVAVYQRDGQYQIIVDRVEPKGLGAQQLALIQLKERLQKEGLFDPAHKKPRPYLPSVVAIITSPTGAALQDILNIINRRFPDIKIIISPIKVQGAQAEAEITAALNEINQLTDADVIILARGGGSAEDLSVFNSELVARAIYNSNIPVISAVGHEIDFTIADLVADKRAATPSEAAELVVPVKSELVQHLIENARKLDTLLHHRFELARLKLNRLRDSSSLRAPFERLRQHQQRWDELSLRLPKIIAHLLDKNRQRLGKVVSQMEALSPLKVLERGYSITLKADTQEVIRSINQATLQDKLTTKLSDGKITSQITEINPPHPSLSPAGRS